MAIETLIETMQLQILRSHRTNGSSSLKETLEVHPNVGCSVNSRDTSRRLQVWFQTVMSLYEWLRGQLSDKYRKFGVDAFQSSVLYSRYGLGCGDRIYKHVAQLARCDGL